MRLNITFASLFAATVLLWFATPANSSSAGPVVATIDVLHNFAGTDGNRPIGTLVATPSGLYGTTIEGGASGRGTIFRYIPGGGVQTVHDFDGSPVGRPRGGLVWSPLTNTLFGTATDGRGTIFQFDLDSAGFNSVAFLNKNTGTAPSGGLALGGTEFDGSTFTLSQTLYGTTTAGGSTGIFGDGTVYRVNDPVTPPGPLSATTPAASFASATSGRSPAVTMTYDSDDDLFYGTTLFGGANNTGAIYSFDPSDNALTLLYSFDADGVANNSGRLPGSTLLLDSDNGLLFGTASDGGANNTGDGTLFEYNYVTDTFTVLATFEGDNGSEPVYGLIRDDQDNLYGVANEGGDFDLGTVFKFDAQSQELITLHSFDGSDGRNPNAGLRFDGQGNLFGTTELGGSGPHPLGDGVLFKLSLTIIPEPGTLTLLGIGALWILPRRRRLFERL